MISNQMEKTGIVKPLQELKTTFIDPFVDFAWKRLFATEESKPILIGLLNHLFKGRKYITEIAYGRNEHHGENAEEGGAVFDVFCTDAEPGDLDTELDKWLYALKHLTEFKKRPVYLSDPEFDQLFNLAKYANLTKEEQDMYNASLKRKRDNKNVLDYAVETAVKKAEQKATERERTKAEKEKAELKAEAEKEKKEMAVVLKNKNVAIDIIVEATGLSIQEIEAL